MKKIILITAMLLVSIFAKAQTFKFKDDGTSEHVVYSVEKMTANQIYAKTLGWINNTFENPEAVTKAKTENEMIRINGFMKDAFVRQLSSSTVNYDCNYTLVIDFQDGKYRTKFEVEQLDVDGGKVYFNLANVLGNVKDQNGNGFDGSADSFNKSVNDLLGSLYNHISVEKPNW